MKKAFTLIEILVVVTIIGLLAVAGTLSYTSLNKNSRDSRRKADLENIRVALEQYRSNNSTSSYPNTGAISIGCLDTSGIIDTTPDPDLTYMTKTPHDPKCTTYTYYYSLTSPSDYVLGAYLEGGGTNCSGNPSCGTGTCNYCLGPYGQL